MKALRLPFYLLLVLLSLSLCACHDDNNNDDDKKGNEKEEKPEVIITRPQDKPNEIFGACGLYLKANTEFSRKDLDFAMSQYVWKRKTSILYDNSHISDTLKEEDVSIFNYILPNSQVSYNKQYNRVIDISGRRFEVFRSIYNSTSYDEIYWIVALDLKREPKRMVVDSRTSYRGDIPDSLDRMNTCIRTFWEPEQ